MDDRHKAEEHSVGDLMAAREGIAQLDAAAAEGDSAGRALPDSEERFRALVQYSSDPITITDPDGVYRYASASPRSLSSH